MSRLLPESARRSVSALVRRRYLYLPVTAVVLAVALAVTLAPRGLSSADATAAPTPAAAATPATAPNDGGITWTPDGTPAQASNGSGDCETSMSATVGGPAAAVAEVGSVLDDEAPDPVNKDDIGTVKVSAPAAASGTSMTVYAVAGVGCDAINQADAYIRRAGYAGPVQFARAVLAARPGSPAAQRAALLAYALPAWLRIAIAAVATAAVFTAVSVVVAATLAALIAATGATAAPAALAMVPGCVAGLAAGPVTAVIVEGGKLTVAQGLASALAECFAGSVISGAVGLHWIAREFQALGWIRPGAVAPVTGATIVADAAAAGVNLAPVEVELAAIAEAAGG